jgi:predicted glycoside hydrolase/deacetylase ChbG (UPF0249 family)
MSRIIITADDFGLTDGLCEGIIDLFECNAISNTNIMICVEGAAERCKKYLGEHSKYAGVHLQITPENHHRIPLSNPSEIPSLVNDDGGFKSHEDKSWRNPDEVNLEWGRQIDAVIDVLGHAPSHLDTHHGMHKIEELTPVYLMLATKYNLLVRCGNNLGEIDGSLLDVPSPAIMNFTWSLRDNSLDQLKTAINDEMKKAEGGVLELVTHPGYNDKELEHASPMNNVRENDHKQLKALAKENWLEDQGIELIRFNNLKKL